jgi:hypothetical protein
VGALAILSPEDTKAKETPRRSRWEPSSNPRNDATLIVTHPGLAPNALRSSLSIVLCKPRVSPCVKRPEPLRCPAARGRHGGPTQSALTSLLPLSPFFTGARGLPACIAWSSGALWGAPTFGAWGIRLVCLRLPRTGLDRFVGASYGTPQQVTRPGEEAIRAYRREESARLARDRPTQAIPGAKDATFPGGLSWVARAPKSPSSL